MTPLFYAIQGHDLGIIELLLANGASPSINMKCSIRGKPPREITAIEYAKIHFYGNYEISILSSYLKGQ